MADVSKAFNDFFAEHEDHEWREVPPCVYCVPCNVRLYQGSLPEHKDPELAARRKACPHDDHETYTDEYGGEREVGEGWYWLCASCGYKGWYDD